MVSSDYMHLLLSIQFHHIEPVYGYTEPFHQDVYANAPDSCPVRAQAFSESLTFEHYIAYGRTVCTCRSHPWPSPRISRDRTSCAFTKLQRLIVIVLICRPADRLVMGIKVFFVLNMVWYRKSWYYSLFTQHQCLLRLPEIQRVILHYPKGCLLISGGSSAHDCLSLIMSRFV